MAARGSLHLEADRVANGQEAPKALCHGEPLSRCGRRDRTHACARGSGWRGRRGFLLHRQCVHVGAQAETAAALAFLQHADQAMTADPAVNLVALLLQLRGDQLGGVERVATQLGSGVNLPAQGDKGAKSLAWRSIGLYMAQALPMFCGNNFRQVKLRAPPASR
jgi:hypothetical protein